MTSLTPTTHTPKEETLSLNHQPFKSDKGREPAESAETPWWEERDPEGKGRL